MIFVLLIIKDHKVDGFLFFLGGGGGDKYKLDGTLK